MRVSASLRGGIAGITLLAACASAGAHAETTALEVAYLPILPMAQLFVVQGEHWDKAAGLALRTTRFQSGPALIQALAAGAFDIAYVGIGPVMVARAKGVDLRVVAANGVEQVALVARGTLAKEATLGPDPASLFSVFKRIAGRPARVATLPKGSVPDTVLRYWLKQSKVADSDVEIIGAGEDRVQQLMLAGAVDAASANEPALTLIQESDGGTRILATGGRMFPNQPGAVLAVRERTLAAHREAITQLVRLHIRATELLRHEPERAAPLIRAAIGPGLIELDSLLHALRSPAMQPIADPHRIIEATRAMQIFQLEIGVLPQPVDVDGMFDLSVYDSIAPPP
jgi:NitT/TauT family transport system substrate-binding protein